MSRERLPDRRAVETVALEHDGRRWRASFGRLVDGRIGEIFIDSERETTPVAEMAREAALLASLCLQHGASLETPRHTLSSRGAGPIARALELATGGAS